MTGKDPQARRPAGDATAATLGWRAKGTIMSDKTTIATVQSVEASIASRAIQIVMAAALGLVVIAGAEFVQISAAHNAAHDYRHSMGFPCH